MWDNNAYGGTSLKGLPISQQSSCLAFVSEDYSSASIIGFWCTLVLYYSLARLQLDWLSTAAAVSMAVQAQYPSNALLPSYRNRLPSPSLCLGFFLAMFFLFWLVGIGNWIEQCGLQVQDRERETENSAENCSVPRDPVLSLEVPEDL